MWVRKEQNFSPEELCILMKSRPERSKFKGLFTLLSFYPKECACWVNVYFIEKSILGMSRRVSVTFIGKKKNAVLPLISDFKPEVLPGPIGSTATWW